MALTLRRIMLTQETAGVETQKVRERYDVIVSECAPCDPEKRRRRGQRGKSTQERRKNTQERRKEGNERQARAKR